MMNMRDDIKADYAAMARGLYEMFDENSRTALKFGMLPEKYLSIFRHQLELKAVELFPDPCKIFSEKELNDMEVIGLRKYGKELADEERKEFVRETEHQVCIALYGVAPMVV
jgi:hypothetical protein